MKTENTQIMDFCCIHELVADIVSKIENHINDDYYSIGVVANPDIAHELIKILLTKQYDDIDFTLGSINFCDIESGDYVKEYIVTVTNDLQLWCEPMWSDTYNEYLIVEVNDMYIYESSNYKVMKNISVNNTLIFGFLDN